MEYALLLIGFLIGGFLIHKISDVQLYSSLRQAVITVVSFSALVLAVDVFGVFRGYWAFPGPGLSGWEVINLPAEEILFSLIMPYFLLVLYRVIEKKV